MVQIIEENRKPQVDIGGAISSFGQAFMQSNARKQQARQAAMELQQENEQIKKDIGVDLTGINDPKQRQQYVADTLQGRREQQNKSFEHEFQGNQQNKLFAHQNELETLKQNLKGKNQEQKLRMIADALKSARSQSTTSPDGQVEPGSITHELDTKNLSDEDLAIINAIDPNVGRSLQHSKDVGLREKSTQNKLNAAEKRHIHEESKKYDDELSHRSTSAKTQLDLIKGIEKNIENISPKSAANWLRPFGKIGETFSKALLSKDQAALQASLPALLEGMQKFFGGRITDKDLALIESKLPDIGKSKEANQAVINVLRKYAEHDILRGEIASKIKKENKGYRPIDYESQIEEQFDNMMKTVRVREKSTGKIFKVPVYKVSEAIKAGDEVVND